MSSPTADREHRIERAFEAPARVLFEAYSKPEHLLRWFGPKGWPLTLCEVDFRVGGRYRFAMTGRDGRQMAPFGGVYLEIVPDRRIVYNNVNSQGVEFMVVTVTFDERADGTTLLRIHTLFDSVETRNLHLGMGYDLGVASALEQLAALVPKPGPI